MLASRPVDLNNQSDPAPLAKPETAVIVVALEVEIAWAYKCGPHLRLGNPVQGKAALVLESLEATDEVQPRSLLVKLWQVFAKRQDLRL